MRIYLVIGMACSVLLASSVHAQEDKLRAKTVIETRLPCFDTKGLFADLRKTYYEVPIIYGKADDVGESTFSIWLNSTTKTYTLVATVNDLSCIVGTGHDFKIVPKEVALGK